MRIGVEGIPVTGREVALSLRETWAVEAAGRSLDNAPTVLAGRFELHKANKRGLVRVEVRITAGAQATCDRCGESCELGVDETLTLLYARQETGGSGFDGAELELSVEDLDIGWYAEGELDLSDVLREAIALGLPARVTCADVPSCDRRTSDLLSAAAETDDSHPFAALAALREGHD